VFARSNERAIIGQLGRDRASPAHPDRFQLTEGMSALEARERPDTATIGAPGLLRCRSSANWDCRRHFR